MKQELLKKIQILERLCGHLRREYEFGLEADEIFTLLNGAREEYLDKLQELSMQDMWKQTIKSQSEMLR